MTDDDLIATLSPHITDARFARMRAVAAARTRHLTAVFDRFYDTHNIAACMRSADVFGLQDMHVVPESGLPEHERRPPRDVTIARAVSLNADQWVDRFNHRSSLAALEALRPRHLIVATTMHGKHIDEVPVDRPVAVLFGNERDGLHPDVIAAADLCVTVPMRGFAQSLNVSVAFAIVMSRLRERIDAPLSTTEQTTLVARWLVAHVPHAKAILERVSACR